MKLHFEGNGKKGNQAEANWKLDLEVPAEDLVALYNSDGEYPHLLMELIEIVKNEQSFSHEWKKSQEAKCDQQRKLEEANEHTTAIHNSLKRVHSELQGKYNHISDALKGFGVNPDSKDLVDDLKEVIQSGKTDWRYPED